MKLIPAKRLRMGQVFLYQHVNVYREGAGGLWPWRRVPRPKGASVHERSRLVYAVPVHRPPWLFDEKEVILHGTDPCPFLPDQQVIA